MNLTTLTNASLCNIQATFSTPDEAIEAMAEQLNQHGVLKDKAEYLKAVRAREEEGPTALGEGLAVPHGKSDFVTEPAFAMATLKSDIKWEGIDGDEDVNLIFLLAIPNAEAGSTHMAVLTNLTMTLVDDDVREAMLKATTAEQVLEILDNAD